MLLVVENTLVIVFSVHGTVRARSAQPTVPPSQRGEHRREFWK